MKKIPIIIFFIIQNFLLHAGWQNIKIIDNSSIITSSCISNDNSIVILSDGNKIFKSDSQQKKWSCIFENPTDQHSTNYFLESDSQSISFSSYHVSESFVNKLNYKTNDNKVLRHTAYEAYEVITYQNIYLDSTIDEIYAFGSINNYLIDSCLPIISKSKKEGSEWNDIVIDDYTNEVAINGFISRNNTYCIVLRNFNNGIRIIKSNDQGNTWEEKYNVPYYNGGNVFVFYNDSIGIFTGNNGFLLKTVDGGDNWFSIFSNDSFEDTTYSFVGIHFFDKEKILLVGKHDKTNEGIICYSENGGLNWKIVHKLLGSTLLSISVKDDDIYCFGRNGMMVKGTTSDLNSSISEPAAISSSQVYPNPATNKTTFSLELETTCNIKIILSDVLGREIFQVYEGLAEAGSFSKSINTSNLAKGVYLLKILIGSEYKVEKFVVE